MIDLALHIDIDIPGDCSLDAFTAFMAHLNEFGVGGVVNSDHHKIKAHVDDVQALAIEAGATLAIVGIG